MGMTPLWNAVGRAHVTKTRGSVLATKTMTNGTALTAATKNARPLMSKATLWALWLVPLPMLAMAVACVRLVGIRTVNAHAATASRVMRVSTSRAAVLEQGHSSHSLAAACVLRVVLG